MFNRRLLTNSILLILLLAACAQSTGSCPPYPRADISEAAEFAQDDQLPFRFPLDELNSYEASLSANFCTHGGEGFGATGEYHAAEDFFRPAGTPVYAMANGKVSFSGPMGGYGWLIIIDHPQANLYSLYGHLSPSRWRIESGTVEKGLLIAYLGDADENGGSSKHPMTPHLHFGVRAGQRANYPSMGEWRWQAGWVKLCPMDIGWLSPSQVITNQQIPDGGFPQPAGGLVAKWGIELLLTGIYLFGAACILVFAIRKNKPFILVLSGVILIAAGWIFHTKGTKMSYVLFGMAILFLAIGIHKLIRRFTKMPRA